MAAGPGGEVPTPLSAAFPAVAPAEGWSSLPSDLVRRIADCLLDTNDVDSYVDLRAVCHIWRSATQDPRSDASDPLFHPRFWIVLDDDGAFQTDGCRVMVNTATGRFLRKQLPLPRRYHVVTTTVSGFFVLADRSPPHAARVLNPLTGAVVSFAAPLPRNTSVAVFFCSVGTLTVLCDSTRENYTAVPDSKHFAPETEIRDDEIYNYMRKAVVGGVAGNGGGWDSLAQFSVIMWNVLDFLEQLHVNFDKFFSVDPLGGDLRDVRCFLLDFRGQILFITKAWGRVVVLGIEPTQQQTLAPVETVGNYAIFIGHQRCLVVDAAKFPSVEADCVYYTLDVGPYAFIWKHNISDGKDERVFGAIDFVKKNKQFVRVGARPFTIIQLLSSYTINLTDSELP